MKSKLVSAFLLISILSVLIASPFGIASDRSGAQEAKSPQKFALLVGINDYRHVSKLEGCLEDVADLGNLLEKKFAFPPKNIVTLTNQQATAEAIIQTFKTHLIENAKKNPNAIVVFHYSGHGSQTRDASNGCASSS